MKYYETTFVEYIQSVEKHNIHPELFQIISKFPKSIYNFENTIIYGPPGVGKYSQMLNMIKQYSSTGMRYDKRITIATDKQEYIYRISDIHYEVDMGLLGCNSKTLWHELFNQIVDIITVKPEKIGIIVCKNFHQIHSELFDIFYSYIQQYNHSQTSIFIKFILITEHLSFLPYTILNTFNILNIKSPNIEEYKKVSKTRYSNDEISNENFIKRITCDKNRDYNIESNILDNIEPNDILNIKELKQFDLLSIYEEDQDIPEDIFNIICDKIIQDICNINKDNFIELREDLYNILTYNLDVTECIWYIICHFINNGDLDMESASKVIDRTYLFFKYYNNNYRPIYHLESILFYIINKVYNFDE